MNFIKILVLILSISTNTNPYLAYLDMELGFHTAAPVMVVNKLEGSSEYFSQWIIFVNVLGTKEYWEIDREVWENLLVGHYYHVDIIIGKFTHHVVYIERGSIR